MRCFDVRSMQRPLMTELWLGDRRIGRVPPRATRGAGMAAALATAKLTRGRGGGPTWPSSARTEESGRTLHPRAEDGQAAGIATGSVVDADSKHLAEPDRRRTETDV